MTEARSGRFKTCFISAPVGVDTAPLRTALDRRDVRWSDAASAVPAGLTVLDTVDAAIAGADFVCAVVPPSADPGAVLFDLGVAFARRRPVLVFVGPGAALPLPLQSLAYARSNLDDAEALRLHLDAFLEHAAPRLPRRSLARRFSPRRVDTSWALAALDHLRDASPVSEGVALERVIARLLEQAGAMVSSKPARAERGVDMAASIDALEPVLGNPLLVEVKAGWVEPSRRADAERRLRTLVEMAPAAAGLLVLADDAGPLVPNHPNRLPLVFTVSARELARLVGEGGLVPALLDARNRAAHGRG